MIKRWWCRKFYKLITRPFNGVYECLECGLSYEAPYK